MDDFLAELTRIRNELQSYCVTKTDKEMTEHLLDMMRDNLQYTDLAGNFDVMTDYPPFDSITSAIMKRAQTIGHADFVGNEHDQALSGGDASKPEIVMKGVH